MKNYLTTDQVWGLAGHLHKNQKRSIGIPYIVHPTAVAGIADIISRDFLYRDLNAIDPVVAEAVKLCSTRIAQTAFLHDTIEDCGITPDYLINIKVDPAVVNCVVKLTHSNDISYADYITDIASYTFQPPPASNILDVKSVLAKKLIVYIPCIVKIADILHNNHDQTVKSKKTKYDLALALIKALAPVTYSSLISSYKTYSMTNNVMNIFNLPTVNKSYTLDELIVSIQNRIVLDLENILESIDSHASTIIGLKNGQ